MVKSNMDWKAFGIAIVLSSTFDLVIFGIWYTGWFSNYQSNYTPGVAGFIVACGCSIFMDLLAFFFGYGNIT